jgi:isoaspartyl peptidase/L-asparaginase-like protein (Ntn-hydrolase superfamily)
MVELHPIQIIKYGTDKAVRIGIGRLGDGKTAPGAVVKAIEMLENDPRFNAGTESAVLEGGKTVQMEAACMESTGKFGAVAAISRIKNPCCRCHPLKGGSSKKTPLLEKNILFSPGP